MERQLHQNTLRLQNVKDVGAGSSVSDDHVMEGPLGKGLVELRRVDDRLVVYVRREERENSRSP